MFSAETSLCLGQYSWQFHAWQAIIIQCVVSIITYAAIKKFRFWRGILIGLMAFAIICPTFSALFDFFTLSQDINTKKSINILKKDVEPHA